MTTTIRTVAKKNPTTAKPAVRIVASRPLPVSVLVGALKTATDHRLTR